MRFSSLLVSLALVPVACNSDSSSPPVGQSMTVPLLSEGAGVVGRTTIANSESTLTVTVVADEGWTLQQVRVGLGTTLSQIPQTRHGEPIPGRFPLQAKPQDGATTREWRLPLLVEPDTVLYFAVEAEVKKKELKDGDKKAQKNDDDKNCVVDYAWGEGTRFPKQNGSMYFTYTVQRPGPPTLAGLYRTWTQEQWGAPGSDAAAYLQANFASVFPDGIRVGARVGFTAQFTDATAIVELLPQSGPPVPLTRNSVNPRTIGNSLVANTLALALNVGFDASQPDSAPGILPLEQLVVADPASPFYGLRVGEVLAFANEYLSNRGLVTFTGEELNDCVLRINRTFENGTVDLGFVALP